MLNRGQKISLAWVSDCYNITAKSPADKNKQDLPEWENLQRYGDKRKMSTLFCKNSAEGRIADGKKEQTCGASHNGADSAGKKATAV